MKYGVALPYIEARKTVEFARMAEENGWDGLFVGDAIWCVDPMVALAAATMCTSRIRLGTMVIPMPLRRPWKVASEAAAIDNLSGGRMILGMGTGAVFMGWQGFPDEVTDIRSRAEMLDEGIDIITLLFQGKQFDYEGKHYHIKLTQVDEVYYPPAPVQKPRIPLWVVGVWPRMKSMHRILKCDGLLPQKMNAEGQFEEVLPEDIREIKKYIDANRTLTTPFDIIVEGKTGELIRAQMMDKLQPWEEAGATWWIEGLWEDSMEQVQRRIQQGPPLIV